MMTDEPGFDHFASIWPPTRGYERNCLGSFAQRGTGGLLAARAPARLTTDAERRSTKNGRGRNLLDQPMTSRRARIQDVTGAVSTRPFAELGGPFVQAACSRSATPSTQPSCVAIARASRAAARR
jgi:hypothetical protein